MAEEKKKKQDSDIVVSQAARTTHKKEKILANDPWKILLYPLLTEKAIGKIEAENKLAFIVKRNANKKQIKWAVEAALNVRVVNVNTMIDRKGRKKSWIQLSKETPAIDIATRLGMM